MIRPHHVFQLFAELWAFARCNKAWWMIPLVMLLLLIGLLIASGGAVAPYIYTLF